MSACGAAWSRTSISAGPPANEALLPAAWGKEAADSLRSLAAIIMERRSRARGVREPRPNVWGWAKVRPVPHGERRDRAGDVLAAAHARRSDPGAQARAPDWSKSRRSRWVLRRTVRWAICGNHHRVKRCPLAVIMGGGRSSLSNEALLPAAWATVAAGALRAPAAFY